MTHTLHAKPVWANRLSLLEPARRSQALPFSDWPIVGPALGSFSESKGEARSGRGAARRTVRVPSCGTAVRHAATQGRHHV